MKKLSTLLKLFLVFFAWHILTISVAQAQEACRELFKPAEINFKDVKLKASSIKLDDNSNLDFYQMTSGRIHGNVLASSLLPDRNDYNRLILGFKGAHSYIYFRGYRIDSKGLGGYKVTSLIKESPFIDGDVAFVLYDLNEDVLEKLQLIVEDFKKTTKLTCVATTCVYLSEAGVDGFEQIFYRPSRLLNSLMQNSSSRPIDIVVLNPSLSSPAALMAQLKDEEDPGKLAMDLLKVIWNLKPY